MASNLTCSWEEVAILVKGYSHHSVSGVEGLLNSIAMMDVNINIQHPENEVVRLLVWLGD